MDSKKLREIVKIFKDGEIGKLKLETEEFNLILEKDTPLKTSKTLIQENFNTSAAHSPTAHVKHEVPQEAPKAPGNAVSGEHILSPMVGTFYKAPSPTSAPFANVGDKVRKDQTLAIIEAMKIMNEIPADFDCKIVDILVEDGQPVEFNTPLFLVERI